MKYQPDIFVDVDGFKYVPGFTRYKMNQQGVLINANRTTEDVKKFRVMSAGYYSCAVTDDVGVYADRGLKHRLLGLSWIPFEGDPSRLEINHIDGIKLNTYVSNLEWTDYKGNILHAFKSGLRTDNMEVVATRVKDNFQRKFYSLSEMARAFGIVPSSMLNRVRKGRIYQGWRFEYV